METKKFTTKEYFNSLRIIHSGLLLGLLIFLSLVVYLLYSGSLIKDDSLADTFMFVVPVFVLFGFFGNKIIFNFQLKSVKELPGLLAKMEGYRSASITRYAIVEGAALFSVIVYQLTGNYIFLGFACLLIATLFSIKPSIARACADLELNNEDTNKLNDPEATIAETTIRK